MEKDEKFDPYGLPSEIYAPMHPLIAMTGLDIKKNKAHRSIWETFTLNRRSDRIPLKFILLSDGVDNTTFPYMKQKRHSYEWYIPKGILKSNWVNKYLKLIPSLLVLFWDLDWSDSNWAEEKNKIATCIQSLRLALGGRNTRIALVLIQGSAVSMPVPGEDGNGTSEKAASLCAACDLPPKQLFVLPHTDSHLLGYTMRLETVLSEISGGFYLGEIKSIKAHRDFLNKTNHHLLFIRHQFKIAFHNEMRSDPQAAIKHYSQCYHFLLEHRFTNTNLHEIRTVATIVNYKICKLNFMLNLPRDAIEQFKKHVEVFRQRTGPKELIFEHYAWLSKQYNIFGEVFEEAVREGLPAVQTQNPGFYYHQAAQYAVLRKNMAFQVCKDTSSADVNLLKGWEDLEFYGQRPWRPGKHSLEPPEMSSESEGIKAMCYYEMNKVEHSSIIIPLFSSAITQYKKYRCPRIKRYLMVQMAKEYLAAQDPSKALTLLNHVMWDYRSERWWPLLSECSSLAISCAYQMASVQEYIGFCLEILGPRIEATEEEKASTLKNLWKVINLETPDPPPNLDENTISISCSSWSYNLQTSRPSVVITMNDILPCLEVRAGFLVSSSPVDVPVDAVVKINNLLKEPLQLCMLIVHTGSSVNSQLKESNCSNLLLLPNCITDIPLQFQPVIQDVEKTVKITGITLRLGTSIEKSITLQWKGTGKEGVIIHTSVTQSLKEFKLDATYPLEKTKLFPEISVTSRRPKTEVKVEYDNTCLVWEWLPVSIELLNNETSEIFDISVSMCLEAKSESSLERTTQIKTLQNLENKLVSSSVSNHPLPNVAPGGSEKFIFYVKTLSITSRSFTLKVSYKCEVEIEGKKSVCPTELTKTFSVSSKIPFQITVELQSLQFGAISKVTKNERFLVVPKIKCSSHVPIELTNSSVGLGNNVVSGGEKVSQLIGVELSDGEWGTDCFCVSVGNNASYGSTVPLGQYLLYWKRAGETAPVVSVSIALPSVVVEDWGLWIEADVPPLGIVKTPLTVAYEITNTRDHVQEIVVSMQVSDAFMFSGHKEVRLRILPGWNENITYTLYPLLSGYVQLPRLSVSIDAPSNQPVPESFDSFIQRILPSHLFVKPQAKNCSQIDDDSSHTIAVR